MNTIHAVGLVLGLLGLGFMALFVLGGVAVVPGIPLPYWLSPQYAFGLALMLAVGGGIVYEYGKSQEIAVP